MPRESQIKAWGPEYMAIEDVCSIFEVSRRTLYNHRTTGDLIFVLLAGVNYVTVQSLKRYYGESAYEFRMANRAYNPKTGRYEVRIQALGSS